MRVAVFSDMHGNIVGFDAVLADMQGRDIDEMVCLGDTAQGGAQPAQVVARLRELGCPVVMGNADAWMLTGQPTGNEHPTPEQEEILAWSLAQLSATDRHYMETHYQPTVTLPLPGGRLLLAFHGSPTSFDDIILPTTPDAEALRLFGPHLPAILCGGHTHLQAVRHLGLDGSFFFNPGAAGFAYSHHQADDAPFHAAPWAEYAILTVEDKSLSLEFRRVPFDVATWIRIIRASGRPFAERAAAMYSWA